MADIYDKEVFPFKPNEVIKITFLVSLTASQMGVLAFCLFIGCCLIYLIIKKQTKNSTNSNYKYD